MASPDLDATQKSLPDASSTMGSMNLNATKASEGSDERGGKSFQNLYVAGLHASVTDAALAKWFEPFGEIRSAKVMLNVRTGNSRGFGFVLYLDERCGLDAFAALNNTTQTSEVSITAEDGSTSTDTVTSTLAIEPSDHDGMQATVEGTVVYLRNIPGDVTEQEALHLCRKVGRVTGFTMAPILPRHAARRKDKEKPADAADASGAAPLLPAAAVPGSADPAHASVSADSGVPKDADDSSTLPTPGSSSSATNLFLASVEFETVEQARAAINFFHQARPFPSCAIPLLAKFADTTELKEYRLKQRKARQALLQKEKDKSTKPAATPLPDTPIGGHSKSSPAGGVADVRRTPAGPTAAAAKPQRHPATPQQPSISTPQQQPHNRVQVGVAPGNQYTSAFATTATGPQYQQQPQQQPPSNVFAPWMQLPPMQAGQHIYFRGTLRANPDGSFAIVQPDYINFHGIPEAVIAAQHPMAPVQQFMPGGNKGPQPIVYSFPGGQPANASFASSLMPFQPTLVPVSIGASVGGPHQHVLVMTDGTSYGAPQAVPMELPSSPQWMGDGSLGNSMPQPVAAPVMVAVPRTADPMMAGHLTPDVIET